MLLFYNHPLSIPITIISPEPQHQFDNRLLFTTGDVAELLGFRRKKTVTQPVPWFLFPGAKNKLCTRDAVQELLRQKNKKIDLGSLDEEFVQERMRIMSLQTLVPAQIAALIQADLKAVRLWVKPPYNLAHTPSAHGSIITRSDLHAFMREQKIPMELAEGYTEVEMPEEKEEDMLDRVSAWQMLATELFDCDFQLAERSLCILLETLGEEDFARVKKDGNSIKIPQRFIVKYIRSKRVTS